MPFIEATVQAVDASPNSDLTNLADAGDGVYWSTTLNANQDATILYFVANDLVGPLTGSTNPWQTLPLDATVTGVIVTAYVKASGFSGLNPTTFLTLESANARPTLVANNTRQALVLGAIDDPLGLDPAILQSSSSGLLTITAPAQPGTVQVDGIAIRVYYTSPDSAGHVDVVRRLLLTDRRPDRR